MPKEAKVTLDGQEFTVQALNIGQLQEVSDAIANGKSGSGFDVLKIVLKRASPKPDLETLAPTIDEIGVAVRDVLKLSGLQKPDANPPTAA